MANTDAPAASTADRDQIVRLVFGTMAAQTLRAAVRLRVFEHLGDTPRTAAAVAAETGTGQQPTTRLLRALTSLGLVNEHTPGTYSVTGAGTLLHRHHPDSLSSFVRVFTEPAVVRAWEHLDDSIRTGRPAFDTVFGTDFFSHLGQSPELSGEFNAAMSQAVSETAAALPHAYDFSRFTSVTDVGGGDATLLAGVLTAHPHLTGVVLDTAEGLAQAPSTLERHELKERCSLVAGDFFTSVPEGSDLCLVKSVLHDWTDDQAVTILSRCRAALPPDGVLLIVEPVLPEVAGTPTGAGIADDAVTYLSDLNMLVNLGGRERTRKDFQDLCRRAGLTLTSSTPLAEAEPFSLLEARPASPS